jgi:hypothetical protein
MEQETCSRSRWIGKVRRLRNILIAVPEVALTYDSLSSLLQTEDPTPIVLRLC